MNKILLIGCCILLVSLFGIFYGLKEDLRDKKKSGWIVFLLKEFLFGGLTTTFFILFIVSVLFILSGMRII